jgi:hypothetical protein
MFRNLKMGCRAPADRPAFCAQYRSDPSRVSFGANDAFRVVLSKGAISFGLNLPRSAFIFLTENSALLQFRHQLLSTKSSTRE